MKPLATQTIAGNTPGPWHTSDLETYPIGILSGYRWGNADPEIVAHVAVSDIMGIEDPDECAANAKLIAAAPSLYEYVRRIANREGDGMVDQAETILRQFGLPTR